MPSIQARLIALATKLRNRLPQGSKVRWIAGGALLVFVVVLLCWLFVLPGAIASRVASALEQRTGLSTNVGGARAGLLSVSVQDVSIGDGDGVAVDVKEIVVPSSPISLAFGGASAVEALEVNGATLRVDLSKAGATALVERMTKSQTVAATEEETPSRPAQKNAAKESHATKLPTLELRRFALELSDQHGRLIAAEDVELDHEGDARRATAKHVVLGQAPGDTLNLRDLAVVLGPALRELSVAEAILTPGADPARARLAGRLLDLKERVLPTPPSEVGDASGSTQRTTRAIIEKMTVMEPSVDGKASEPVLESLSLSAERKPGQPWHLQGDGRPRGDGKLAWNVRFDRDALVASGDVHFDRLPLSVITPLLPAIPWYRPEDTTLAGDLTLHEANAAQASFEGRLEVRDLGLASERIASAPVAGVLFVVESKGHWQTDARKLIIDQGQVQVGRAKANFAGFAFDKDEQWGFDLEASLPPTRCGDAVGAIPTDLLAEVSGFSWQGQIAGSVHAVADSTNLDEAKLRVDVKDGCSFESAPSIAELGRFREPFTHRVLEGVDEQGREDWFEMSAGPGSSNWTSIWDMSPFFVHAVLAHEDASFFRHAGFAPWAIDGAFRRNLKAGRYVVGASTISMQLSKNLFLHREKTLARKAQEVILTWWLENRWDKRSILEMYFNVIEYGPRVYGVTEAAQYYFGRDAAELSLAEAAFLATILPNPKKYHASYARGALSPGVANKMRFLIRHMGRKSRIDAVAVEHGLAEVDRFAFQKPDEAAPPGPRTFVGTAASLPYMMEGPFASPIATEALVWDDDPNGDESVGQEAASEGSDEDADLNGW